VRFWLSLTFALARPLAALRVPPDALTMVGLLVACAVVPIAALGGRWPVLGAVVLVGSGLLDNLDGAVAVLTGRVTRWGALLDAVADRLADGAACLALWAVGGWAGLALGAGVVGYLHEYARARAGASGMSDAGVITVAERPTRLIVVVMFLLGAGIYPGSAASWGTAGAACLLALGLVGFGQLLLVVRRSLR
jgi:CDP-diacylglycerol--glycerol-3-phosphate 3-phosphatidyltransferase